MYRARRPLNSIRTALVVSATAALAACGSQSAASESTQATTAGAGANVVAAAAATNVLIDQGIYADSDTGGCGSANELFFYDGRSFGYILAALPGDSMNSPRSADLGSYLIDRVGKQSRNSDDYEAELEGFVRIWTADDDGAARGIKADGAGRFIYREGSMSARQMEYSDDTYQKCAATQLSAPMQAAVQQFRPGLANMTVPAGSALQATSKASSAPIESGYWAGGISCADAILEATEMPSDQASLYYITPEGGWIGRFQMQRIIPLGGKKYRMIGIEHSEIGSEPGGMDITVKSRTSFTDTEYGGLYTYCQTSQVPADLRAEFESR